MGQKKQKCRNLQKGEGGQWGSDVFAADCATAAADVLISDLQSIWKPKKGRLMKTEKETFKKERRACDLLAGAVLGALKDRDQFRRYIVAEKKGEGELREMILEKYDVKSMLDVLKLLEGLVELRKELDGKMDREDEEAGGLVILPAAVQ